MAGGGVLFVSSRGCAHSADLLSFIDRNREIMKKKGIRIWDVVTRPLPANLYATVTRVPTFLGEDGGVAVGREARALVRSAAVEERPPDAFDLSDPLNDGMGLLNEVGMKMGCELSPDQEAALTKKVEAVQYSTKI